MAKNMIKELIILLLLCLAIILLLGILMYEYIPMKKTIPNPVSYTTPENVKQELAEIKGVDENQIIMTYEVDSTDLNNYKSIQDYKPGKANPFSSYETTQTNATSPTTGNSSVGGNGSTGGTSSVDNSATMETNGNTTNNVDTSNNLAEENKTSTSGGQFFQDKGIK